ncbi:MAG: hypothetical protein Q8S55_23730 [Methylococcaceae bacterium]|nr:hypothetical protein [Methylococcaceae bacterium]
MATTNYTETLDSQDFVAPYHYVPVMVHNDGSEHHLASSLILKEAVLTGREVFDTDKRVIGWNVKRLPIVPESTFTVGLQVNGVNGAEYIKLKSGFTWVTDPTIRTV